MNAVNLRDEAARITELFDYTLVARMNGHTFTLIKAENRTLDFHSHPDSDEVFHVLEGEMVLEFRDGPVPLAA